MQSGSTYASKSLTGMLTSLSSADWVSLYQHNPFARGHFLMVATVLLVQIVDIWASR